MCWMLGLCELSFPNTDVVWSALKLLLPHLAGRWHTDETLRAPEAPGDEGLPSATRAEGRVAHMCGP